MRTGDELSCERAAVGLESGRRFEDVGCSNSGMLFNWIESSCWE